MQHFLTVCLFGHQVYIGEGSNTLVQLCALSAKAGPGYFLIISCLVNRAAPSVTYLPEATTVLAHRVFSMLRLSLTGGSPSSCNNWDDKHTEWSVKTGAGQINAIFVKWRFCKQKVVQQKSFQTWHTQHSSVKVKFFWSLTHTCLFRLMLHMFFSQDIYAVSHYAFTTLHDILQEGSSLLLQTANTPTHF